jgi:hypothetical protein
MPASSRSHPKYGSRAVNLKAPTTPATSRPIKYTHFQSAFEPIAAGWACGFAEDFLVGIALSPINKLDLLHIN